MEADFPAREGEATSDTIWRANTESLLAECHAGAENPSPWPHIHVESPSKIRTMTLAKVGWVSSSILTSFGPA